MARAGVRALLALALGLSGAMSAPRLAAQRAPDAVEKQPPPSPSPPAPARRTQRPDTIELDLDRIREALARPGTLKLSLPEGTPMFRVDVEERLPDLRAWLGDPRDLRIAPQSGTLYHQEFLDMVTPPEARASFTSGELAQVAATGLAGGLALQAVMGAIKNAIASGRRQEACSEVRQTLEELNEARRRDGLPPVPVPTC